MRLTDDEINTMDIIHIEYNIKSAIVKILTVSNIIYLHPVLTQLLENVSNFEQLSKMIYEVTSERVTWLPISLLEKSQNNGWVISMLENIYYIYYYKDKVKIQSQTFLGLMGPNNVIPHLPIIDINFKKSSELAYNNYYYPNYEYKLPHNNTQSSIGYITGKHYISRTVNLVIRDSFNAILLIESPQSSLSIISCQNSKIIYLPNKNKTHGLVKVYYSYDITLYIPKGISIDLDIQDNMYVNIIYLSYVELWNIYNQYK